MSRLLKITDLGSGIMVQGTDNVLYPDNATLTYPYNSIVVVTDESNIATFRSASNNDVLFSGLIGKIEIGGEIVTKENINVKFDEIANQETGGGGGTFADASYDSQTKRINFYDKDGNIVSYIDATDFIKDGMVSNVEILNGNLVITFNTDSGKQPISIPLTDIFNPNQYYTKTEIDSKVDDIWNTIDTKEEVISTALNTLNEEVENFSTAMGQFDQRITANTNAIGTKANASEVYSKTESDAKYATQVVVNEEIAARIEAIRDVNTALEGKADKSDTYTKTQVDTALSEKVSQTEFDAKEEVISTALNELEENKQNKLTAGANITIDANNVISATIPDTSEFVTKAEYNPKELAIAEALTDLNENKADASDVYTKNQTDTAISTAIGQIDLSDYQTKEDADVKEEVISTALNNLAANKQDALTAGTGISIQNNVISATGGGGGTQQQADWNQTDTTAVDYIKNKPTIPSQFTDVDDIQKVSALPANPDSRTLYLIPVQ